MPQGQERPWTFIRRLQVVPEPQPLVHFGAGEVHDGRRRSSRRRRKCTCLIQSSGCSSLRLEQTHSPVFLGSSCQHQGCLGRHSGQGECPLLTGTRKLVSVSMTLLFLQGDVLQGGSLASPHPFLGATCWKIQTFFYEPLVLLLLFGVCFLPEKNRLLLLGDDIPKMLRIQRSWLVSGAELHIFYVKVVSWCACSTVDTCSYVCPSGVGFKGVQTACRLWCGLSGSISRFSSLRFWLQWHVLIVMMHSGSSSWWPG